MGNVNFVPKVSVIVPVFKPGDAIKKCLKSLQNQSLWEIELIFIDDCGNDGSLQDVSEAAENDQRIRILKNEKNSGPGASRNRGIEAACGEYLAFVDADDYVADDYLELLYRKAINSSERIVRGTFAVVNADDSFVDYHRGISMLESIREGVAENKPLYSVFLTPFFCAVFLRSWIVDSGIRFGTMNYSEDKIFLLQACHKAGTMEIEEKAVYYYVQNPHSLVHTLTAKRLRDSQAANEVLLDYVLTNIEKEEISVEYLIHLIEYPLVIQAAAARQDKLKAEAAEYLNGLTEQSRSFPDSAGWEGKSSVIAALREYGANISTGVYWDKRAEEEQTAYMDAVLRVYRFALCHPERKDLYGGLAKQALRNLIDFQFRHKENRKKENTCPQDNLKRIRLQGASDCKAEKKVRRRFMYYYCDALVHAIGHPIKQRIIARRV